MSDILINFTEVQFADLKFDVYEHSIMEACFQLKASIDLACLLSKSLRREKLRQGENLG